MDIRRKTEYQYMPFIVKELEDVVGGASIALADLRKDLDSVPPGAFVGRDEKGLCHVLVAAVLVVAATDADTTYKVKKGSQVQVGQFITTGDVEGAKAYAVTAFDTSSTEHDVITVGTTLGKALAIGQTLHEVKAEDADGGKGELKFTPEAITKREIDTTGSHAPAGLLVRGTVNVANMAFGAPEVFRKAMPLMRFE